MPRATPYRIAQYFLLNLGFVLLVGILSAVSGGHANPRTLYLILLFAICSHIVIDLDALNGRYALLALFMVTYFVSFGVGDLSNLLFGFGFLDASFHSTNSAYPDKAELAILAGGIMLVLGYRAAIGFLSGRAKPLTAKDWSRMTVLAVGLIFWAVGTVATYRWNVYVIPDTTDDAFRIGLSGLSPAVVTLYLIGGMCQPLGILLLAYAWNISRSFMLFLLVTAVVVLQMFIGFVIDAKGTAMFGIIAVIVTGVLVGGRLPKAWIVVGLIFVTLLYPYFTAYRRAIHGAGIARTAVVENFGEVLRKTIAAKDEVNTGHNRAQNFLERSNVKGSVEVAIAKAGDAVPYAEGYTLWPIVETFLPKIFWAGKIHIPTGQLFNKKFHLVEGDEVYISPSHLGELYWNFGWLGVVIGMGVIGLLCGTVGALFNTGEALTVTRILITVITIKQLIISFESTIADCYVVWFRSLAAIGLMHFAFARVPLITREYFAAGADDESSVDQAANGRLFPNLLT